MPASQLFSGTGDPNGIVFGNPGDVYQDETVAFGKLWVKETGVGTNTGWIQLTASVVTAQQSAIVDPALGNDATGAFGNLGQPFKTIQAALNAVPIPVDAATARTVWTILVSPGTYDEDLSVDLTHGKKIVLASWGPWNLGLFNNPNWQPSNERSIAITTSDAVVFDFINPSFAIQPMLPAGTGDETEIAQSAAPRISGNIDLSGVFAGTPAIDLVVEAQIYGTAASATAIEGGATDVRLRVHRSRMRRVVEGSGVILQDATESRFDALVDIQAYGRLSQCFFGNGMTIVATSPSSNTIPGFYLCQVQGTFTGPAGFDSYWWDEVTSYWAFFNGATFGAGTTKRLVEETNPTALPALWRQDNVPAATTTALPIPVSNFSDLSMIRSGSIVGMRARLTQVVTAGSVTIAATINGVATGLTINLGAGSDTDFNTIGVGAIPYVQGDLVGAQFATDAAFTPVTTDLEVWLEVVEEAP